MAMAKTIYKLEMKNEMRFYKVIIVAYMSINNLYPQVYMAKDIFSVPINEIETNKISMEKLDINKFTYESEALEKERDANMKRSFLFSRGLMVDGDTVTTITESGDYYYTKECVKNSAFVMAKSYYKSTLTLYAEGRLFYGFSIGLMKVYDKNGQLIEVLDKDKFFPFSVEMLIKKFKNEFDMDLTFPINNDMEVLRLYSERLKKYIYVISIPVQNDFLSSRRFIEIDGTTGMLISDELKEIVINQDF